MTANSEDGIPDSQSVSNDVQRSTDFEDGINLIDYFRVLWKYKWLIVPGSVLPALIVGLVFFFSPRNYKVTYVYDARDRGVYDASDKSVYDARDRGVYDARDRGVYDARDKSVYDARDRSVYDASKWNLDEKNYNVLLDRFYSEENIGKIADKLRENGLADYAALISKVSAREELKNFVDFEALPPYVDLSKVKVTDPDKLVQIRQFKADLLKLMIRGRPKSAIPKICLVIRDNLENVIPVYFAGKQLNAAAQECRAKMADIEENRFELELALKTNGTILTKLKNIRAGTSDETEGRVTLQFDVGEKSEYLPVGYQIQAAESKTILLEEQIAVNEKKYSYYESLCTLNEKLFADLKGNMFSYYTIQQFHAFLADLVNSYKDKELKDYLNSYIKRIENRISASVPVTEKPRAYGVAKGTVRKSAIVLAISLMLSIFAAFLLEGLKKNQAQVS